MEEQETSQPTDTPAEINTTARVYRRPTPAGRVELPVDAYSHTFGSVLAHIRKEAGIRQEALAELVDIAPTHVSRIENDTNLPRRGVVMRWAVACRLSERDTARLMALYGAHKPWEKMSRLDLIRAHAISALEKRPFNSALTITEHLEAIKKLTNPTTR